MKKTELEIKVRYQETDKMGIVHHSVYPIWFELGRTEFLEFFGMTYKKFEKLGYYLPLIELNCKYKFPAKFGDIVRLESSISKLNKMFVDFEYKLYLKNKLLCIGKTKHVCTNTDFKPVKFNQEIYKCLDD